MINIQKLIEYKIKQLKEVQKETFIVQGGIVKTDNLNDDIKREQQFYELAKANLQKFRKNNEELIQQKDQEYLFKNITGQLVYHNVVKSIVQTKNQQEKDLNQQGKKIQQMLANKDMNEQKMQRLVEQVKKQINKPIKQDNQEQEFDVEQKVYKKQRQQIVNKKGIKKQKLKRKGKLARLHQKLKQNSRKQK